MPDWVQRGARYAHSDRSFWIWMTQIWKEKEESVSGWVRGERGFQSGQSNTFLNGLNGLLEYHVGTAK